MHLLFDGDFLLFERCLIALFFAKKEAKEGHSGFLIRSEIEKP